MATISAVAYARYSSDKQQESSITVQLAAIRKFCNTHRIELIHEYIDEAQTGTNANRKEFQEMVSAAPEKQFQLIIVHRMDRWARNVDDARYYKKYFAKYGIRMISSIEEFDESPEGEFFELMSMGMAELYSKKLSREATAGLLANAREGKVHGGAPSLPFLHIWDQLWHKLALKLRPIHPMWQLVLFEQTSHRFYHAQMHKSPNLQHHSMSS